MTNLLLSHLSLSPSPLNRLVRGEIDGNSPEIRELAESIRRSGIVQSLNVIETPGGPTPYQILNGERRWRATCLLGVEAPLLPCVVKEPMSRREQLILMGVENLQRENMPPVSEGRYYRTLMVEEGMDIPAISQATGKLTSHIKSRLELLDLEEEVQEHIDKGRIPMKARDALVSLPPEVQIKVAGKMIGKSVRSIKQLVRAIKGKPQPQPKSTEELLSEAERLIPVFSAAQAPADLHLYIYSVACRTLCAGCRLNGLKPGCETCQGGRDFINELVEAAEWRITPELERLAQAA